MTLSSFLLSPDPVAELWHLVETKREGDVDPALARLRMAIPHGYHHKDNLGHSVRVLDNAIARETQGPDLILRTAALLHDIGKPDTRRFGEKGEVTFRNHETVGAKQASGILKNHGYSQEQRREVKLLIRLHMRAFGFGETNWTDSGVRRLMTDAGGEQALDRLITIFYSDLTTTNERRRRRIEAGIARLEDALASVRERDVRAALRPALNGNEVMALTGLTPGRQLGTIMKYLNSDEGITLSRDEALAAVERLNA